MSNLNLNQDYNFFEKDLGGAKLEDQKPVEFSWNYIQTAFSTAFPQGVDYAKRATYARIQRKLDQALVDGVNEVELERAEVDLLKEAFKGAQFHVSVSKYVQILDDAINAL